MKRHNGREVFRAFLQCSAIYVSANWCEVGNNGTAVQR